MIVSFYYSNSKPNIQVEIIIKKLCKQAVKVLTLPSTIDICFYDIPQSTHGAIDQTRFNRIILNNNLRLNELPMILVHELIHVEQRFMNKLIISKDGIYTWQNNKFRQPDVQNLNYEQYLELPWEVDVQCRIKTTLKKILDLSLIS